MPVDRRGETLKRDDSIWQEGSSDSLVSATRWIVISITVSITCEPSVLEMCNDSNETYKSTSPEIRTATSELSSD